MGNHKESLIYFNQQVKHSPYEASRINEVNLRFTVFAQVYSIQKHQWELSAIAYQ